MLLFMDINDEQKYMDRVNRVRNFYVSRQGNLASGPPGRWLST